MSQDEPVDRVTKGDAQWREQLGTEQFRIARQGGTERAFTGKYWDTKTEGSYHCVCCGETLFSSAHKYDSGSGWPSFTQPANDHAVCTRSDESLGMRRTEVLCRRCDAHLGHAFPDGPTSNGIRFCINSASLDLEPEGED